MNTAPDTAMQLVSVGGDLLKVILGGVIAACLTLWVSGRRQDQDRLRAARHLAIRLIDAFERFAVECAMAIGENRNSHRDSPYDYGDIARLPELDDLPDDEAGWRALEPSFAIEARTFGNQIKGSLDFIRGAGEFGDADDVEQEVNKQAVLLGSAAWEFARELRSKYALPEANPPFDVEETLREENERLERMQAERAKDLAELWAEQNSLEDAQAKTS